MRYRVPTAPNASTVPFSDRDEGRPGTPSRITLRHWQHSADAVRSRRIASRANGSLPMALRTEVTLSTAFEAAVVDRARPLISPERKRERSITWRHSGGRADGPGRDDGRLDVTPDVLVRPSAAARGANRGGE